jgi:aminopeptidase N
MYYKGGNMLHTLRNIIDDDELWRGILRGLSRDFYHQVVKGSQIEAYLSEKTNLDLKSFFDQYLRDVRIPVFEYYVQGNKLTYRWNNCVDRFNMPLRMYVSGVRKDIVPTTRFTTIELDTENPEITIDANYYAGSLNMTGK